MGWSQRRVEEGGLGGGEVNLIVSRLQLFALSLVAPLRFTPSWLNPGYFDVGETPSYLRCIK